MATKTKKPAASKAPPRKVAPAKAAKRTKTTARKAAPKAAAAPPALTRRVKRLEKQITMLTATLKKFMLRPELGPQLHEEIFFGGRHGEGDGPGGD